MWRTNLGSPGLDDGTCVATMVVERCQWGSKEIILVCVESKSAWSRPFKIHEWLKQTERSRRVPVDRRPGGAGRGSRMLAEGPVRPRGIAPTRLRSSPLALYRRLWSLYEWRILFTSTICCYCTARFRSLSSVMAGDRMTAVFTVLRRSNPKHLPRGNRSTGEQHFHKPSWKGVLWTFLSVEQIYV